MLSHLDEAKSDTELTQVDLLILHLAILFHDVIYKVPSENGYNEIYSVLLFQEFATEASLVLLLLEHRPHNRRRLTWRSTLSTLFFARYGIIEDRSSQTAIL